MHLMTHRPDVIITRIGTTARSFDKRISVGLVFKNSKLSIIFGVVAVKKAIIGKRRRFRHAVF